MRRTHRRILFGIAAACGVVVSCSFVAAWRSLPEVAGEHIVQGLSAELEIVRDSHAVPHIYARTVDDAYFGLGYVHAQDRLWQMEVSRRMGTGMLAEVFGESLIERDRMFRSFGLARLAEENWKRLDAETKRAIAAYSRGVNAWLERDRPLPVEFSIFGVEPAPWKPTHCIVFHKVMAWSLAGNWGWEAWRVRMGAELNPGRLADLAPPYPGDAPIPFASLWALYDGLGISRPREQHGTLNLPELTKSSGSNNWVVAGDRTASGKPLLANDPHLRMTAPSQWYLAHLNAPGLNVIGATLPGLAGVILGRNDKVAWAFTNTLSDTQDLFLERLGPRGDTYLTSSGSRAFTSVREVIRVRGGDPVEFVARSTHHGPVFSESNETAAALAPPGHVVSLAWTALRQDDETVAFPIHASRSASASALLAAARKFHSPQQNIVYADTNGAIGFIAAGRIPERSTENALKGLVPAPGWLTDYDWTSFVPFEELPQIAQPPSGRIVTANNKITPAGYTHWMGAEWAHPHRANRIEKLLEARRAHTVDSFAAIQVDIRSGAADEVLERMIQALPRDLSEDERALITMLSRWDRSMQADAPEPLIFAAWVRELGRLVYADELGDEFEDNWTQRTEFLTNVLADKDGQGRWCDDQRTAAPESCAAVTRKALQLAQEYLALRFGSDRSAWKWADAHAMKSEHMGLADVPVLSRWFNIVERVGGDGTTVNVADYDIDDDDTAFTTDHGAGFRAIYDLGNLENSRAILSTGQSGNVFSAHYRDMSPLWASGKYVPLATRREVVEVNAIGTLVLRPR